MILWFSGTGNSQFVAEQLGSILGDEVVSMNQRMIDNDFHAVYSERPYVIVSPTYGFNLPRVVKNMLIRMPLNGAKDIYFVLTCGASVCGAAGVLAELAAQLSMQYKGCGVLKMPENYIVMFNPPKEDTAREIIRQAIPHIHEIADTIQKNQMLTDGKTDGFRKLGSEFDEVIVVLPNNAKTFMNRRLLYTAVTRAKRKVTVFTSKSTLKNAIDRLPPERSGRLIERTKQWI